MIDKTKELLDDPEYFHYEKLDDRLRVDICIGRQKANEADEALTPIPYTECEGCSQGQKNWVKDQPYMNTQIKPRQGNGYRNESCPNYSECLAIAAKKEWGNFTCIHCKNTRICEECNEKITINPSNRYCASCLGKKANADRQEVQNTRICEVCKERTTIRANNSYCASCLSKIPAKNKPRKSEKMAGERKIKSFKTNGKGHPEISSPRGDFEVTICFEKYESIFQEVKRLADEEMRPFDLQVLYILKKHLNSIKESQKS